MLSKVLPNPPVCPPAHLAAYTPTWLSSSLPACCPIAQLLPVYLYTSCLH
jgi:hypothetical protein